ncbi:extracellular solute-binding protein [Agromyces sp. ISL-38]|uniref:ABC transporter substrate-binding protein n=1 Tax=Agromyces sp. ISL-38 TaxID=2819107 RepID=UPI001BEAA791|nr:extracellular solute-binding protein [Agromyces sp. ISL-38]MBT2500756.1 extracellular solute-binding protein [Agromyces sp. ISL-38]
MTDDTTRPNSHRRRRAKRRRTLVAASVALGGLLLAGCGSTGDGDVVTLDFFQFKGEALADFDEIIADFEAENPDIRVVQNQVPDADTAIRTLLVKNKTPDVITLNASGNFGQLAKAGVFHDFTGDPILDDINPAVQEILAELGTFHGDEVNSLGYVSNADGIIYNRDIFAEQGLEVPTTWGELIDVCEKLQAAGITPFYGTLTDGWTTMPAFNGLGAYAAEGGFFDDLRAEGAEVGPDSEVSFQKDFGGTLDRLQELYSFAQDGYRGRGYDDGNPAFANGESAMYLQGVWALAPILDANPDFNAGIFPYPTDDPDARKLVSGVDVTVTIGRDTDKLEAAKRFVAYLFQANVMDEFAASQNMFSAHVDAQPSENPALAELQPFIDEGRITGFIDHQIPPAVPLIPTVQEFLFDGDADGALATLDNEWRKVAARTTVSGD